MIVARGLARPSEPGEAGFLARIGPLGDAQRRPGVDPRAREVVIVAAPAAQRRAIKVGWEQIEKAIPRAGPCAGVPRAPNAIKVLRTQQEEDDR